MRNDIVKNKKLFSQYKFKLIKTIWNYFEHTELPLSILHV